MYVSTPCVKVDELFELRFCITRYRYVSWSHHIFYVCYSSSHCSSWSSAFIVVVLVNMTSNNGLCVSLICQDPSVAMGCVSHMHGVSCGAVFAAEVACFFLAWGQ